MCTSSRRYQDMLVERREECSNFMWASRQINPQVAFQQETKPTPLYHKEQVLKSTKMQELLEALSREQNVPKEALENQVRSILDEIGYNKKLKLIRWLGLVLVKICNKVCSGIYLSRDSISQVKHQMGGCPVIFVPSHRSYADFILMSLIFFNEDLAIPAIGAGMDFHGMWGMGTVLRDTGAFFMRRTYNNDALYWTTFRQYVYQMITKGDLSIEFFIEGTRSRTNKSLMPKYGLILMILKAFFLSQVPDIWFVPINISYDRILEEKLFAFELLGIPKPKESTSGFFKSLSIVKEKYGSIYFDMAEPISVAKFFGPNLDETRTGDLRPVHQREVTDDEKKLIPALAHEIVHRQQKHCVISTFNLLAIALQNNLLSGKDLLTLDELIVEVSWLRKVVETLGGFVQPGDLKSNVLDNFRVHKNIVQVDQDGKVTLVWNKVVLEKASVGKLKAHELSERTLTVCVPFIMLQIYINPVLHYIVDVAILVVILRHQRIPEDELFGRYHFLRALLSQEFVTFSTREKTEFESAVNHAVNLNLLAKNDGFYETGSDKKCEDLIYNCIDGFIFTYYVVCSTLLQTSSLIDEKAILTRVQSEVEMRLNEKNAFIHPYSLSLDTITNCLNTLAGQKVLTKSRNKNSILYEVHHAELSSVKTQLEQYVAPNQVLQRRLESVQLHLKNKL